MPKSTTIKDIARELHISVSTVSRALQNHAEISEATRKHVQECAQRLNYRPNILASNLRTSHNTTIGVVLPELNHHFFSSVLDGIEQVAAEQGYTVLICQSHENVDDEVRSIRTFLSARVAGVLVGISKQTTSYQHLQEVINSGIPLVLYDRPCASLLCDQVVSDDYAGAFAAVEYMIQTGCKDIAYFSSPMQLEVARRRYQGFRDAMQQYGLTVYEDHIVTCDTRTQAIIEAPHILRSAHRPDAIFCVNDHCAAGVLYAAQILDIKIPDELSICGFSNDPLCRTTMPMLTTVQQHGAVIGRHAMRCLINRINGDTHIQQTEMIPTDLIVRETSR